MAPQSQEPPRWRTGIAAVVPCYKVARHIGDVIAAFGPEVDAIYCVDDACPENSGAVAAAVDDRRVRVVTHEKNRGVGGAVMTGYRLAVSDGATVIVKVDGDGQMDPRLLPVLVAPILSGNADYTKGNRFWNPRHISAMPRIRRFGNLVLGFMAKASTGYWNIFDPTNGYTAIHALVAEQLPWESISERYFFETDMLFRLNTLRAAVVDVPMDARYGDETSSLRVTRILGEFLFKHFRNLLKRIIYNYYLRDLSVASLELVAGTGLLLFAGGFGGWHWWQALSSHTQTALGTIMIPTLSALSGLQFVLAFLGYDIVAVPKRALHPDLVRNREQLSTASARNMPSV